MANTNSNAVAPAAKVATLTGAAPNQLTFAAIVAWVNANGGPNNVYVQPLSNVAQGTANPVPFGYNGKPGGVRQLCQGWLLNGYMGNRSYAAIHAATSKLQGGHGPRRPYCLAAMLNGGYSPSSHTWGVPYVQLTTQPPAQWAKQPPAPPAPVAAKAA